MLRHYWIVTLRNLRKQRSSLLLNVIGLATGLSSCLLIGLIVAHELSYDRGHRDADRIYRAAHEITFNGREIRAAMTPGPLAGKLQTVLPGVEKTCRVVLRPMVVSHPPDRFIEDDVLWVDPSFFEIFSMPVVAGRLEGALARPDAVVLTRETAQKYFGSASPVGESLVIGDATFRSTYTVTAVVEDISDKSHLGFDFLLPIGVLPASARIEEWSANNVYTYLKLRQGAASADLQRMLDHLVEQELGPAFAAAIGKTFPEFQAEGGRFGYFVQPLRSIHLESHLEFELRPNGDRRTVMALTVVAALILLIACVTYVNLATARSTERAREVGLRKALGAEQRDLAVQFLFETLVTVGLAGLAAMALVGVALRLSAGVESAAALWRLLLSPSAVAAFLGGLLLVVVLAGVYPARVLSALLPDAMLRQGRGGRRGKRLRQALVVLQFAVATALIAWALVIQRQMDFIRNKDLGFQPQGVVVVDGARLLGERWTAFKEAVERVPGVVAVSGALSVPGRSVNEVLLAPEGSTREEEMIVTALLEADADFVRTLGIRLREGSLYSGEEVATRSVVLLNETARHKLGGTSALGRLVTVSSTPGTVTGVFADIYLDSLRTSMRPAALRPLKKNPRVFAIRLAGGEVDRTLQAIGEVWRRFAADQPFAYSFLETEIQAAYEAEHRLLRAVQGFALIAILLSCLGIYGLAAYSAARQRKEIGIRRAIGASAGEITGMLVWDFLRWVAVAVLLAVPAALYVSQRWLERFAYRTDVPAWLVPAAGVVVCLLSLAAVSSQALRAAAANPADCLKEE